MFPGNDFQNYKYLCYLIIRKFPAFRAYISCWFTSGMNSQAAFVHPTNLKPEIQTLKKRMPDNSLLVNSQGYFCLPAISSGESVTIKVIISRKKDDVFICTAHSSPPFISCTHHSVGALTLPLQRRAHSQGDRRWQAKRSDTEEHCIKARLVPHTSSAAAAPALKSHIST